MCSLRLLSNALPRVTDKTFQRKYIALGRIVTSWNDIIGQEMAEKAQPVKLHYRKAKNKDQKPTATLDIATSSAHATVLAMQKGVILERINQIFGDSWVTDIRFIHAQIDKPLPKRHRSSKPLSEEDKSLLAHLLEKIEDQDIKERLNRLGQALLQDRKE